MPAGLNIGALPRRRRWFNALTRGVVALGAAAVAVAILLMLAFLVQVAAPLFRPAAIGPSTLVSLPAGQAKLLYVNSGGETALRVDADGRVSVFALTDGEELRSLRLPAAVASAKPVFLAGNLYAALDSERRLWLLQVRNPPRPRQGARRPHPQLKVLFGGRPMEVGEVIDYDLAEQAEGEVTLALLSAAGLQVRSLGRPLAETPPALGAGGRPHRVEGAAQRLLFGPRGRWLFTLGGDGAVVWRLDSELRVHPSAAAPLADAVNLASATPLLERQSLLIGSGDGGLGQWSLSRADGRQRLALVRSFPLDAAPSVIVAERQRKGFVALDEAPNLHLGHATSGRLLARRSADFTADAALALAPRGDLLLALEPSGRLHRIALANTHPEVSWTTLFAKVQYESYEEPVRMWQPSSANAGFEPKFSLAPLLFGSLKAAFYAMLFAAPVAVMGAIHTACFMTPGMRRWIKPTIEMMAALPTVVLGFLAGLWLAPLVEANLAATATLLAFIPGGMLLFAALWRRLGDGLRKRCEGWQALIAIAPIIALAAAAIWLAPAIEAAWFDGDLKAWLFAAWGMDYAQRNALVVGLAMGVAVIPLIFTIAEDAIHAVPPHLADASLALGATHWQTVTRVILLTASPGIFSALMIGLGRAAGETMIVLMATGNTPIMDFSILQGMRTLAANIAVELPESEVGSTHYRLLYLTALLLFAMTFACNAAGDLVRERLRRRFGNL